MVGGTGFWGGRGTGVGGGKGGTSGIGLMGGGLLIIVFTVRGVITSGKKQSLGEEISRMVLLGMLLRNYTFYPMN